MVPLAVLTQMPSQQAIDSRSEYATLSGEGYVAPVRACVQLVGVLTVEPSAALAPVPVPAPLFTIKAAGCDVVLDMLRLLKWWLIEERKDSLDGLLQCESINVIEYLFLIRTHLLSFYLDFRFKYLGFL
jgi:hypothetical protein